MSSTADIFNQVRSAVDIVEVVGEHVALKRAGREFKGLCPFHDDHRPSMAVVPHKQIFHCFVCGMGGDVFKFVKEFHKMGNGEALRMLAQRAGIKLPELPKSGRYGGGSDRDKDGLTPRERIAQANEWACVFFEKHLRTPQGKTGLDYFYKRGLTDETIGKFRLGMSPDGWTGMVNSAMRLGVNNASLAEAGLVKQRSDSSPYDAFRNRVIFPIIDASGGGGRVIAFGGRVLEEKRDENGNVVEAKYLNSPDSPLFNKSESLYGLNVARQAIIRTRTAVVVEGYMDVIACHQAGVSNVIATLGTALTPDHAKILKNYAQTIVLVFDSDDAGRRAADRALEVFVRGTLDIKLASVPDGKDPCDFCMKNGGEAFQKIVDNAIDALSYKWQQLARQFHGTGSIAARQEAVMNYLRFLAPTFDSGVITDPVRRALLLSKVSGMVNMKAAEVEATLDKLRKQAGVGGTARPVAQMQPPNPAGIDEEAAAVSAEMQSPAPRKRIDIKNLKRLDAAEGWLLGALLCQPVLFDTSRELLSLNLFVCFRDLATVLLEYFENHPDLSACTLADFTATLEELGGDQCRELVRQSIELERRTADWIEPQSLSPNSAKLVQQLADDRGMNLETLLHDSVKELQSARGSADPAVEADFGEAPAGDGAPKSELDELKAIMDAAKARNAGGGDRRVVG